MSVPTHNSTCTSRAFPTRCNICSEEVFFFFCSCVSKVFFESLGSPWIIHRCIETEHEDLIQTITDHYGRVDKTVLNHLMNIAENKNKTIPQNKIDLIIQHLSKTEKKFEKRIVQPENNPVVISGKVMECNFEINFYKKFKLEKNIITQQLLGELGKESFTELTVRTYSDFENHCEEFITYIPSNIAKIKRIRKGSDFVLRLVVHQFVGGQKIWMIDEIS